VLESSKILFLYEVYSFLWVLRFICRKCFFLAVLTVLNEQHYDNPLLKYIYTIPICIISARKTVHFSLRNGPFGILKRAVLQRKMICISNLLIVNIVQSWCEEGLM